MIGKRQEKPQCNQAFVEQGRRDMPYTDYPMTKAIKLATTELKPLIEEKKKTKDKKQLKVIEEKIETASKKIMEIANADLDGVTKNMNAHQDLIQEMLGDAQKELSAAKKALDEFRSDPVKNADKYDTARAAKEFVRKLVEIAEKDAIDFGKSWTDYRMKAPKATLFLDGSHADSFNTRIGKIMDVNKNVTALAHKLKMVEPEAAEISSLAKAISDKGAGHNDPAAIMHAIEKGITRCNTILIAMMKGDKVSITSLRQSATTLGKLSGKKAPDPEQLGRNVESLRTNASFATRTIQESYQTIKKVIATVDKAVPAPLKNDQTINKALQKLAKFEEVGAKLVSEAAGHIKTANENADRIQLELAGK